MAVSFTTSQPKQLLAAFDARIAQSEPKGQITTWQRLVHSGVAYYTHAASQWHRAAYFKPAIENGKVTFYIANPQGLKISTTVYGYYHGHLAETFLNHFDEDFTIAICTAKPVAGDSVAD